MDVPFRFSNVTSSPNSMSTGSDAYYSSKRDSTTLLKGELMEPMIIFTTDNALSAFTPLYVFSQKSNIPILPGMVNSFRTLFLVAIIIIFKL